jgi:three-Cys-motif partner protein
LKRKSHTENVVGPWAEEKLAALEKYLQYYCLRLSKTAYTLVYIDGFSGAPVTTVRLPQIDTATATLDMEDYDQARQSIVLGSPIRALRSEPGFHRHYFFDIDEKRVGQLEDLKLQYPEKWVHVEVGDANERIRKLVAMLKSRREVKGVAFLDPYKENLDWETVEALAGTRKFEVIINLPLHMAINRILARGAERNAEWESRIDRCFGTESWREVVYPDREDMFGPLPPKKADGVPQRLLEIYIERLRLVFGEVATPRLIRNTKNSPLYFLIWAGPHKAGLKGANYILGSGERLALKRR